MDPQNIYLVQTDTTVGLVSKNKEALARAKQRDASKPFLITTAGLCELKKLIKTPKKHRKLIRRAKKTTFVYPHKDLAIRVVHEGKYKEFLKPFGWMYSTSANLSGAKFDDVFAKAVADIVIEPKDGFRQMPPSRIMVLGKKQRRLR
jgi:tRNA A37 threonylcarbamoyladenosine synthetase subunit TsaC/SUA5/YrdC